MFAKKTDEAAVRQALLGYSSGGLDRPEGKKTTFAKKGRTERRKARFSFVFCSAKWAEWRFGGFLRLFPK